MEMVKHDQIDTWDDFHGFSLLKLIISFTIKKILNFGQQGLRQRTVRTLWNLNIDKKPARLQAVTPATCFPTDHLPPSHLLSSLWSHQLLPPYSATCVIPRQTTSGLQPLTMEAQSPL
jgi:hypothetical protein